MITLPTIWFVLVLLLSFLAGLIVSFWSCTSAANEVYKEAEQEQRTRFTKNIDKYLS